MHCTCPTAARRAFIAFRAALLALPCALFGQTIEWKGSSGGSWASGTNWSPSASFGPTTDVLLQSASGGASMSVTQLNGEYVVRSIILNNHLGTLIGSNASVGYRVVGGTSSGELRFETAGVTILDLSNTVNFTQNVSFNSNASQSITLNLNYNGAGTINVGAGSSFAMTANGTRIIGTGGLIKDGEGTLRLGFNASATAQSLGTYSGGMELKAGLLEFTLSGNATSNPFGTGTLRLSGGQLASTSETGRTIYNNVELNGSVELGSATNTGNITFNDGGGTRSTTLIANSSLHIGQNLITWDQAIGESGGSRTLTKTGAGTLRLNGVNTYTGLTTISGGTLDLRGSLAGGLHIAGGVTFIGAGSVAGATTIAGIHHPGNSPGIQSFGSDLTYLEGASIGWELAANSTVQDLVNPIFDQVNVVGTLQFDGLTLLELSFNLAGSSVDWSDVLWTTNQSWVLFDAAAIVNPENLVLATSNWADAQGDLFETVLADSSFGLEFVDGNVVLNYSVAAIPEPSTYAALFGLAGLALAVCRRRTRRA